jgi:hypothetical protein
VKLGSFDTWDFRNYQYYLPYALLNGRFDFDYAAAQIQTFLNPAPFVPFYLMTTHLKPMVAGFVMGGIHGLVAGLLFLTALSLFSAVAALPRFLLSVSCASLGIYGPTFFGMLGGAGNDNLLSLVVLAAVYALIRGITVHGSLDAEGSRKTLLIGGVLLGTAAGLKLVCLVFVLGCGIAVIVTGTGWRSRLTATGLFGFAGVLGFIISRGFWMAFLWSKYGSPLFPFYNRIFKSPYYYDINFADGRFIPKSLAKALLLPFYFFTNTEFTRISHQFRDIRYTLIYVLILLFLIVLVGKYVMGRRREALSLPSPGRANAFLLVFFVTSYVIWQSKFAVMRYAAPLELLAPILIAVLVRSILSASHLRAVATVIAFIGVAVIMQPRTVPRQEWSSAYINVEAPKFDNPSDTMVILADNRPWAYVIPFFQPEVRFVGLCSNFSKLKPEGQHRATDEMLTMASVHRGPMYLLSRRGEIDIALRRLQPYNIVRTSDACIPVLSRHERRTLCLWPIAKKNDSNSERRYP